MTTVRDQLLSKWKSLTAAQRMQAIYAFGAMVALAGFVGWWSLRPNWSTLYAGLSPDEARQIAASLSTANLSYDVSADGTSLRVPTEELDKARLTSASKAAGKSGRLGYELFDKPDWAGSDFDDKVNYQRALEGELEKTINTISDVESCSVHLVLPHDSLFTESQRTSKASVVIRLRSKRLTGDETESIKALIANAVDGLSPDNVALVDADGRTLAGRGSVAENHDLYERSLSDHILQTLEPIVGVGNVRATVNVDYDFSSHDILNEDFNPASVVTLSMQRSEQTTSEPAPAAGVPGTASNTPNQKAPLFPASKSDAQSSKQESGTYGASKKTEHSLENAGRIRRITAAVLLNDRVILDKDPHKIPTTRSWNSDELKQIANLSQAAIGFDSARGDSVVVQNVTFETSSAPSVSFISGALRRVGNIEGIAKYVSFAVVALGTLLIVIRPVVVMLKGNVAAGIPIISTSRPISHATGIAELTGIDTKGLFDQVAAQIQSDPTQSARVLQTWIRAE